METIMFTDKKQAELMKWIRANLSDDPGRPSINKFMLDPEHDRIMATNGFVVVIADLFKLEYKALFGDRAGTYKIIELNSKLMVIEKEEVNFPDVKRILKIEDELQPNRTFAFDPKLLINATKPFDKCVFYQAAPFMYFVKLEPDNNMPDGTFYAVIMGINLDNYNYDSKFFEKMPTIFAEGTANV